MGRDNFFVTLTTMEDAQVDVAISHIAAVEIASQDVVNVYLDSGHKFAAKRTTYIAALRDAAEFGMIKNLSKKV